MTFAVGGVASKREVGSSTLAEQIPSEHGVLELVKLEHYGARGAYSVRLNGLYAGVVGIRHDGRWEAYVAGEAVSILEERPTYRTHEDAAQALAGVVAERRRA